MNFERGQDPKKAMNIGITGNPVPGRKFLVRFKLRESTPEFYSLQDKERNGDPIIATCLSLNPPIYDPSPLSLLGWSVTCEIEGINSVLRAIWNMKEKSWEII